MSPASGFRPVLILAPLGRDGTMTAQVLDRARIGAHVCSSISELVEMIEGADAAVVAEESLDAAAISRLTGVLAHQPTWSDFPIVVLGRPNSDSADTLFERLSSVANLTLLERPTRPFTLVTVTRAVLRARRRQHLTRQHLEDLVAARADAERAGRMKDEFLATLSHELRTPLSAISGWVHLLQRGSLSPEDQQKAIETIARNTKAQRDLIEDLLDMSRIIAGKVRLELQAVKLDELVLDVCESVRPAAAAKGVTLKCRVEEACEGRVVSGDPARLQQAAWNLLTNAVKFTPKGGEVSMSMSLEEDELTVRVRDTGVGISKAFLPYVFDRFRQADSSSKRSHGGLGLGLSIVKQLVEMHGGRVGVRSDGEGRGSEFFFALPLTASVREPAAQEPQPEGAAVRPTAPTGGLVSLPRVEVLLVDDDVDGRDVVARFLTDAEATVRTAGTVEEARRVLASSPIDVLLSDIGMPGEDGYDLIRWVRASESPRIKAVPAVALTAFARADDRLRVVASGYNDHVSKPVDPDALIAVVHRLHAGAAAV